MIVIRSLNDRIDKIEEEIKEKAEEIEEVRLLMSILGFSYFLAITIYGSIGEIGWFPGPKELSSYRTVIPSTKQSGGKKKHGPITKEDDNYVRRILTQCA